VAEIEPSIGDYWPGPLVEHKLAVSHLPLATKDIFLENIEKRRPANSALRGFRSVEKRILRTFSDATDVEERLKNLGVVSKCLLALVSTLPFLLTLPHWLQQTSVESYKLSVESLQQRLVDLAQIHTRESLGQIEEEATVFSKLELEAATNAISSSFLIPDGYSTGEALPDVGSVELQMVTGALANLIAFNAAINWIRGSIEKLE